jgi:hemoglobin
MCVYFNYKADGVGIDAMFLDYNLAMTHPDLSLYEQIGGEPGLRALVERFYDIIDLAPEAAQLRALHPKSLRQAREKFFMFLSGWSGGPQLYVERFGHPRLRMRHMPFSIGIVERDQWIWCMNKALDESKLDSRVVEYLKARFAETADFLRNQES